MSEQISPLVASLIVFLSSNRHADAEKAVQRVVDAALSDLAKQLWVIVESQRPARHADYDFVINKVLDDITAGFDAKLKELGIEIGE